MKGAPMGFVNTPGVYQERIVHEILGATAINFHPDTHNLHPTSVFANQPAGALQWLDDTVIYSDTFEGYLKTLEYILSKCVEKKLRLNIKKCQLLSESTEWCGRIIYKEGWKFRRGYFDKILNIPNPTTVQELETVVYMMNWLSLSIPNSSELTGILHDLMMEIRKIAKDKNGKRLTKSQRNKISLKDYWKDTHKAAFMRLKAILVQCCEKNLALYDEAKELHVYTDASYNYWSAILLQFDDELDGTVMKPERRPLYFLSGRFKGSESQWSVPDKELFPILKTLRRFRHLTCLYLRGVKVHTDHRNLICLFHPPRTVKTSTVCRLYRWVLLLQEFRIKVIHIQGNENIIADCLTRWGYNGTKKYRTVTK